MHSLPQVGSLVAERYRVVRAIGEGGMGAVFEAVNTRSGKQVAIKWLRPQLANNAEASARLVREARASCRVRHPNVVDIYDVVQEEGCLFLVMEYLEGEALSEWLERGGGSLVELVRLLLGAMRGVAAAHQAGVIHRDIHPANIFLARQPGAGVIVPKVLDFGISKVLDDPGIGLTRSGVTMGTPMYMSYEQMLNARDIDARTDVYSFGVILYQAVTGHTPFSAETFAELVVKAGTGSVTPPKQLRPEIPTALDRLICWAIERDPERRLGSMELLIQELVPFASEHAFRNQMTLAAHTLPAVGSGSARKSSARGTRPSSAHVLAEAEPEREVWRASAAPPRVPRARATRTFAMALAALCLAIVLGWLTTRVAFPDHTPIAAPKPSHTVPVAPSTPTLGPTRAPEANADAGPPRGAEWSARPQDADTVELVPEVPPTPAPSVKSASARAKQLARPSDLPPKPAKAPVEEAPVKHWRTFRSRVGQVNEQDFHSAPPAVR